MSNSRRTANNLRRRVSKPAVRLLDAVADRAATRPRLRQADGNMIGLLPALNEIYLRQTRIENKLDLLLGQRPITTGHQAPALRTATLTLPTPPPGWSGRREAPPATLELEAHWSMFVARVLADNGLARYEPSTVPHVLAALELAPAGAMLDIGANVGPYALLARAFSDRDVVAFEPTPDLADVARRIGERNGLGYVVEQLALGDHEGLAQLYLSDSTDSSNTLNPTFRRYSNVLDVPLERLDTYLARTGVVPGLLKIDTETTEPAVLRGALETVAKHRPWIFCEVLAGAVERELTEVVEPWGYTWYHLTEADEVKPVWEIVGDPTFTHFMYLLVPEPLGEDFWSRVRAWHDALEATLEASPGA